MKRILWLTLFCDWLVSSRAATTINAANKFSCGANLGWMDWRGDLSNGAVIGEYLDPWANFSN